VSGTQRLRLVLALGVVNLVLATVALGYGLSAPAATPGIGAVPTSGAPVATTGPTVAGLVSPTPVPTAPAVNPTPAGPLSSGNPGEERTPGPSVAPSPVPSAQPSPVPSLPVVTQPSTAATPGQVAVVVRNPAKPTSPPATQAPPQATPAPSRVPVSDGPGTPGACRASERGQTAPDGKACQHKGHKPAKDHHDSGRHRGAVAGRPDGQADRQPAIAESRPASKTRHRLRVGRRAR
jgi:hypothetical protein